MLHLTALEFKFGISVATGSATELANQNINVKQHTMTIENAIINSLDSLFESLCDANMSIDPIVLEKRICRVISASTIGIDRGPRIWCEAGLVKLPNQSDCAHGRLNKVSLHTRGGAKHIESRHVI